MDLDQSVYSDNDGDAVLVDRDDISNYNPEQILPEPPEELRKIRAWLEPTAYDLESGEYRKHRSSHVAGTGSWLTSSTTYQEWLNGREHGMLWIKGIPGSGKSVIAAHLIDEISRSHAGVPVLYFFFRQIIDANHAPAALLRDWIDQVLEFSPPLQKQLKEYREQRRSMSSISMDDLWKNLRLAFSALPSKVFCVADALDEMDQGNGTFLEALASLGRWKPAKVKVLITSRPVPSVEGPLRKAAMLQMRLDETQVDEDISTYVEHGLKNSHISSTDQELVRVAIPGRANGLFLYAKLAMDAFLEPGVRIDQVLNALPADLNQMYTNLLREHAQRSGVPDDIQLLVLQWVTHATRPLRLLEIAEMINVTYLSEGERDLKTAKDLVRAAAGPLLEILPDETVCVIHHSFTEYLKGSTRCDDSGYPILRSGSTHSRLALACLSYLQSGSLDGIEISRDLLEDSDNNHLGGYQMPNRSRRTSKFARSPDRSQEKHNLKLKHPFIAYAAINWHVHVARSTTAGYDQTEVNQALNQIFDNPQHMQAWLKMQWDGHEDAAKGVTPLHIAAKTGLTEYARLRLAKKATDVNTQDARGRGPLWWAATGGHAEIIRILVANGADPDQDEKECGLKPLHMAASQNHFEAVRALLGSGVDPLTKKTKETPGEFHKEKGTTGETALMYACQHGHLETIEVFLSFLKDINTIHGALAWSASRGHSKLVQKILRHPGVDVNAKFHGDTPLFRACGSHDKDTIAVLIEAGADPNVLSEGRGDNFKSTEPSLSSSETRVPTRGFTALHNLCAITRRGYITLWDRISPEDWDYMLSILIESGADIHQRTDLGDTALHGVVDNPILVRKLLDAGADANAINSDGHTPLHIVRSADSLSLLIENGHADINKRGSSNGATPLHTMLDDMFISQKKELILKFLTYRPDCTIKDRKGNGLLHLALRQHNMKSSIVKALLDAGADANEMNQAGNRPLHAMQVDNEEFAEILDILLNAGADLNARDSNGTPLLFQAIGTSPSFWKHENEHMKMLLQRGASLHARDAKGRTLLHEAVRTQEKSFLSCARNDRKRGKQLDFLLSLGMDARVVDYRGNTLLHELAIRAQVSSSYPKNEWMSLWKQLIDAGVDLDKGNYQGRTPLHILAAKASDTHTLGYCSTLVFVISQSKCINCMDQDGLTPLHVAATVSEYNTKKLLEAGANPALATFEGSTPLHLATIARESNIVGLLLDSLAVVAKEAITSRDTSGNTPLWYACRSGKPETVRLLLDAGADGSDQELFGACVDFEDEQDLWIHRRYPVDMEINQNAGGLTKADVTRPNNNISSGKVRRSLYNPLWRLSEDEEIVQLNEIIRMLIDNGADLDAWIIRRGSDRDASTLSFASHKDYTIACFQRASKYRPANSEKSTTVLPGFSGHAAEFLDKAVSQAIMQWKHIKSGEPNQEIFASLLKRRQYHALEDLFDAGVDFLMPTEESYFSNLEILIKYGFASLVDKIGSLEVERNFNEGKWHAFGDRTCPGLYTEPLMDDTVEFYTRAPLIHRAVLRAPPNMEVVRLLVEKFHVDINEVSYIRERSQANGKNTSPKWAPMDSALHYLARGSHWWHSALAIPYFIAHGAALNLRGRNGQTPLHVALGGNEGDFIGIHYKDAAKALIHAGADVNAVDGNGMSCLAWASHDVELVRLLIENEATLTADSIFAAIERKQAEVLDVLLSAGVDPNIRAKPLSCMQEPNCQMTGTVRGIASFLMGQDDIEVHELYPLYSAATKHSVHILHPVQDREWDLNAATRMVETLLSHGANPFMTIKRNNSKSDPQKSNTEDEGDFKPLILGANSLIQEDKEFTILHELLLQNELVHPILKLPKLDVNYRDAKGRTVLHAACHHSRGVGAPINALCLEENEVSDLPTFLDHLLALGADPLARDHDGRNVLHHMFDQYRNSYRGLHFSYQAEKHPAPSNASSLAFMAKKYPVLVEQRDCNGMTPLHLALRYAVFNCGTEPIEALLDAGADPFALDKNSNSPLHFLAYRIYGSTAIRDLFPKLVARGLDINARNARGETPLFNLNKVLPKRLDNTDIPDDESDQIIDPDDALRLFEDAGADLFVRDEQGRGLLHVAGKGKEDRFKALMDKGLDPMLEDNDQRTAIDVAAACNNKKVLGLFEKDGAKKEKVSDVRGKGMSNEDYLLWRRLKVVNGGERAKSDW